MLTLPFFLVGSRATTRPSVRRSLLVFLVQLLFALGLILSLALAVTVVGYGMKHRRFTDVHRAAVRWPLSAWKYVGIDNEGDTAGDYAGEVRPSLLLSSSCSSTGGKRSSS